MKGKKDREKRKIRNVPCVPPGAVLLVVVCRGCVSLAVSCDPGVSGERGGEIAVRIHHCWWRGMQVLDSWHSEGKSEGG
jgi:hypothetical protein